MSDPFSLIRGTTMRKDIRRIDPLAPHAGHVHLFEFIDVLQDIAKLAREFLLLRPGQGKPGQVAR